MRARRCVRDAVASRAESLDRSFRRPEPTASGEETFFTRPSVSFRRLIASSFGPSLSTDHRRAAHFPSSLPQRDEARDIRAEQDAAFLASLEADAKRERDAAAAREAEVRSISH